MLGLVLALIVAAIGFCLFDGDSHEHQGLDLCLGMLATSPTVSVACRLPLAGAAAADGLAVVPDVSEHVPAPPPKTIPA